jgi:hypothetical protein
MLEVARRSWRIRKVHEQDRVDVLGSGCLIESGAICVDVEERISGRKRTKRRLHYRLDIGRIQDDESVDGHLSQARCHSALGRAEMIHSLSVSHHPHTLAHEVPYSLISSNRLSSIKKCPSQL